MQSRNVSSNVASPAFITHIMGPPQSISLSKHSSQCAFLHSKHLSQSVSQPPACVFPQYDLPPVCLSFLKASSPSMHLSQDITPPLCNSPKSCIFHIYSSVHLPACISPSRHLSSRHLPHRMLPQKPSRITWKGGQLYRSVDKTACHASLMTRIPASEPR